MVANKFYETPEKELEEKREKANKPSSSSLKRSSDRFYFCLITSCCTYIVRIVIAVNPIENFPKLIILLVTTYNDNQQFIFKFFICRHTPDAFCIACEITTN